MAVPAEDERDWAFAIQHGLPIVRTVQPPDDWDADGGEAYTGDGVKINSGFLDGLDIVTAKALAIDWLEENGIGERKVNYRLRDWLVSRQRFWGCPIPAVYCPEHGVVPVPEDQLPIVAPDDVEFLPDRAVAARPPRGFPAHDLPDLRWPGPARDRHHGHLRRLVVVLPALLRPLEHRAAVRPGGGAPLHARRSVHRRHRARHPPPALRPLLHPCSHRRRPGARPRPGALQALPRPGHDPHGRDQDVQVQGQPHRARALLRHGRRRTRSGSSTSSSGRPFDDMDWSDQTDEVIDGCGRFLDRLWRTCTADAAAPRRRADRRPTARCARPCTAPSPTSPGTWNGGPTTPPWRTAWSCSTWSSATGAATDAGGNGKSAAPRRTRTSGTRRSMPSSCFSP